MERKNKQKQIIFMISRARASRERKLIKKQMQLKTDKKKKERMKNKIAL